MPINQNEFIPNHSLEFFEPTVMFGKRVLATLDRSTSFPFETQEEIENTKSFFKKASESDNGSN